MAYEMRSAACKSRVDSDLHAVCSGTVTQSEGYGTDCVCSCHLPARKPTRTDAAIGDRVYSETEHDRAAWAALDS